MCVSHYGYYKHLKEEYVIEINTVYSCTLTLSDHGVFIRLLSEKALTQRTWEIPVFFLIFSTSRKCKPDRLPGVMRPCMQQLFIGYLFIF